MNITYRSRWKATHRAIWRSTVPYRQESIHSLVLVCETETHEIPATNLESILSENSELILSRVMAARPGSILIIGTGEDSLAQKGNAGPV